MFKVASPFLRRVASEHFLVTRSDLGKLNVKLLVLIFKDIEELGSQLDELIMNYPCKGEMNIVEVLLQPVHILKGFTRILLLKIIEEIELRLLKELPCVLVLAFLFYQPVSFQVEYDEREIVDEM
jgi:hypothetical protein